MLNKLGRNTFATIIFISDNRNIKTFGEVNVENYMNIGEKAKRLTAAIKNEIGNENHDVGRTREIILTGKELINHLCDENKKTKKQDSIMRKRLRHAQKNQYMKGHGNMPE